MKTLEELKNDLLADGIIDADEAKMLRSRLYEDGSIDTEEAEFLFEVNDAVSGKENALEWNELFIDAICDYLLADDKTPGEIDEVELKWLLNKIGADGKVDSLERELLLTIRQRANTFPEELAALI